MKRHLSYFRCIVLLPIISFMVSSCTQMSEQEKLKQYLLSVAAENAVIPPGEGVPTTINLPGGTSVVSGTPIEKKSGFCGDGIINGENEHCDKDAMAHTKCSELDGGLSGALSCSKDCHINISDCLTVAADARLGGLAETCKCNCQNDRCSGGCAPSGAVGMSRCRFDCDSDCVCKCEGKLETHVESCKFSCFCQVDANGNPICDCTKDECEVLAITNPNIATISSNASSATHR